MLLLCRVRVRNDTRCQFGRVPDTQRGDSGGGTGVRLSSHRPARPASGTPNDGSRTDLESFSKVACVRRGPDEKAEEREGEGEGGRRGDGHGVRSTNEGRRPAAAAPSLLPVNSASPSLASCSSRVRMDQTPSSAER